MSFEFKLKKFFSGIRFDSSEWVDEWLSYSSVGHINKLLGTNFDRSEILSESENVWNESDSNLVFDKITNYFIKLYFSNNILTKIDRASMLNGIETRVVFTDLDLFNFLIKLPQKFKKNLLNSKIILKKTFMNKIPQKILNRSKQGFAYPVLTALNFLNKENFFKKDSYINDDFLKKICDDHFNKKIDHKMILWAYVNFKSYINQ